MTNDTINVELDTSDSNLLKFLNKNQLFIYIFIGILIHVLIFIPFFSLDGIYLQDDFAFHRLRLENYVTAVQHGDFFPKIFPEMANGYGYAADLFYPSILLLPYVGLRQLGFSYINSFYLYHLLISIATFGVSFLAVKKINHENKTSFLFAIIYSTATYRLMDQFIRGALGETLAFIFLPLVFWGMDAILKNKTKNGILLAIGMSSLFYSHLITTFIVAIFLSLFVIYLFIKNKLTLTHILSIAKAALLAFLMCAFTLLPMIEQTFSIDFNFSQANGIWADALNYSMGELVVDSLHNSAAVWENLAPNIGTFLLMIIMLVFFQYKSQSKKIQNLLIINLLLMVVSTNLFPWSIIRQTIFGMIQFPWRWLTLLTFSASLLAAYKLSEANSNKYLVINITTLIAIISVSYSGNIIHQFNQNDINLITNDSYSDYFLSSVGGGREYIPVEADYQSLRDNKEALPIHNQTVTHQLANQSYKMTEWTFESESNQETVLLPNLTYVGYEVLLDNDPIEIKQEQGLLAISIPQGRHQVKVKYVGTSIQRISLMLSIVTWLLVIVYGILNFK
ncbi:YfhO family protein [Fundicoccus sp. Sow4_H7]|uniref:YfhO family protein n=1 Tax=Fundicoccus sp. Sow4_H7 TaxID=3438784 RepID=UPI003F92F017